MRCIAPLTVENGKTTHIQIACRQCVPCKVNKRRKWVTRMLLENLVHKKAAFITLTYETPPEFEKYPGGNLRKKDGQIFIRELRRRSGLKIRFFLCGEYGEKSGRAHMHAIVWGLDHDDKPLIDKCWNHGFTFVGDVSTQSIQYVANYVTKKIRDDDEYGQDHYKGRQPEFATMSKNPGLGNEGAELIAETLLFGDRRNFILDNQIRIGGQTLPLDSFMKRKIDHYMRENGATDGFLTLPEPPEDLNTKLEKKYGSETQAKRFAKLRRDKEKI